MIGPTPIRALVADDEAFARQRILQLLRQEPDFQVVRECAHGGETVEAIRELKPDVVFLDIQMPELDGFGVLEAIGPERMPLTIFATAFDQHAMQAFEVSALDYLLKPIDPDRMAKALARARAMLRGTQPDGLRLQLETLLAAGNQSDAHLTRVLVKHDEHHVFVKAGDIQWIEAEDNYVRLHVEGTSHLLRMSMATLLSRLDPKEFRRIHRSSIVNLDQIHEVHPWFSGDHVVIMKDGTRLTMSRTYRDQFKELG
ncbi:MAG: response regulator transcription factor [Rhodospirillales bacterium]|nr:MAG: response regulator transcription factor [Rhodospirillales bacterium]